MENNKPEWLLKAEEELAKFAKTKIGKMNQKEFEYHERQVYANKCANEKLKALGYPNLAKNWTNKEAQRKGGLAAREVHRASGFMKRFCLIGSKATGDKFKLIRLDRTKLVADMMEEDKSYTLKEMYALDIPLTNRVLKNILDDTDDFNLILKTSSQGVAGTYKKI